MRVDKVSQGHGDNYTQTYTQTLDGCDINRITNTSSRARSLDCLCL